jgi:hypothetical protein
VAFRRTRSDNDDNRFPSAELDLRPRPSRYRLTTLQDAQAYIIIGIVAIVGTFLVRAIWRTPWLSRYVGILSTRMEKS